MTFTAAAPHGVHRRAMRPLRPLRPTRAQSLFARKRCSLVDMVDIPTDFYDYDIDYDYCDYDWWIIYDNTIMIMIMILS